MGVGQNLRNGWISSQQQSEVPATEVEERDDEPSRWAAGQPSAGAAVELNKVVEESAVPAAPPVVQSHAAAGGNLDDLVKQQKN